MSAFNYLEIRSTLPDELLLYADKLSMAHGIEARVPYLDQDVIDYALGLPPSYKVHVGDEPAPSPEGGADPRRSGRKGPGIDRLTP